MPQLTAAAQALHILSLGQSSSEVDPRLPARPTVRKNVPVGQPMGEGCGRALTEGLQGQGLLRPLAHPGRCPAFQHHLQLLCPASSGLPHTSSKVPSLPAQLRVDAVSGN